MPQSPASRWRLVAVFLSREIKPITGGVFYGLIGAALVHLCAYDGSFRALLKKRFYPNLPALDSPAFYAPYVILSACVLILFAAMPACSFIRRGIRSWYSGVTSGLGLISFVLTLLIVAAVPSSWLSRLVLVLVAIAGAAFVSYRLHARAEGLKQRLPIEEDVRVSLKVKELAGTRTLESDDPIQSWEEDTLGRAALVDSLSVKVLIAKAPVIALFGDFGSGKTSILNLLRTHLTDKAIVISFSTWLPGSQETLTSYLMADIASEAQKHYVVPGLKKSTRKFANALGETVPFLKGLPQLLPTTTQKDDIDGLRQALLRLPQRVVVLLDELDRMEKLELKTLLKVVRGISSLPNLSFVCAAERTTLIETVRGEDDTESNIYFEKFFPVAIPVPRLDENDLRHAGVERIVKSLAVREWFLSVEEEQVFRKQLDEMWPTRIAPFCGTLRAIGLLANDVGISAAPLHREVDSLDLVLVELLRRFQPSVYELVSRNGVALTGGLSLFRGGAYHSDEERKRELERFRNELKAILTDQAELDRVRGVLGELFPDFAKSENLTWRERPKRKADVDKDTRISDAEMFPSYFRYELPKAIFSTIELEAFIRESIAAQTPGERKTLLEQKLRSMPKGSLKKDDFFRKLSESVKTVDIDIARAWIAAALTLADDLTYDTFSAYGESGHVIRMIIRVGERLAIAERVQFLSDCILDTTDDTIAMRVLNLLTNPQSDGYQRVSFEQLYPSFIKRMRTRYGLDVDVRSVDLTTSDRDSFNLWGFEDLSKHNLVFDPENRKIQYDFWKRYIGDSRSRLIRTFNDYLMPLGIYEQDPKPFIARKIAVETLRELFERLPDDDGMKDLPSKYLRRMKKFLDGAYERGIGIDLANGEPDEPEGDDELTPGEV